MWGLASAVILEVSVPTVLFETPLYPPGTGWPSFTPGHWVTFASPITARWAAVEEFETATRED
jgi:hypothetical protein